MTNVRPPPSDLDVVEIVRTDALLDIRLTDPEGGNLVSNAAGEKIAAALAAIEPSVRLVRLSSTGRDFCRGRVSPMPRPGASVTAEELKRRVALPALRVYDALRDCPALVMCVVRGRADGFGCGLVGASDLALASDLATFAIPEMARNIPPTLVMTALGAKVPAKAVAQMVLSQDVVDARQALGWGLVGQVVADADLETTSETLTAMILGYAAEPLAAVKEYLRFTPGLPGPSVSSLAANLAAAALSARFAST